VAITSDGKPLTGDTGITFQVYKNEVSGEALWAETQSVAIDSAGHYKVQLGASNPNGLPSDLFANGEARWLEVQIAGQSPRPRVLIASVPYALKAGDATTLGGLPVSAFALAGTGSLAATAGLSAVSSNAAADVTTTGGTANNLAKFSGASTIVDSILFDTGTEIGIGTSFPAATLDVRGTTNLHGAVSAENTSTATKSAGSDSYGLEFLTSAYDSSTGAAVKPLFEWRAEPTGNDTATPGATLNLLSSNGIAAAAETGFHFNANGTMSFASGQTFPGGTGTGTITGVTAGTDLTGGGTTGNVTLNLNTAATDTRYARLGAANGFTGNQTVTGIVSATLDVDAARDVDVDSTGMNAGNAVTPGLRFGDAGESGEAITSGRASAPINQYGLDFWTNSVRRVSITNDGLVGIGTADPSYQLEIFQNQSAPYGALAAFGANAPSGTYINGGAGVYGIGR